MSGTAYILPKSIIVHGSITGVEVDSGIFWFFGQEGKWDKSLASNPVGTVSYQWLNMNTGSFLNESKGMTLNKTDCAVLPFDGVSSKDSIP